MPPPFKKLGAQALFSLEELEMYPIRLRSKNEKNMQGT